MSETCRDGEPLRRSELEAALEGAQRVHDLPKGWEHALRAAAVARLTCRASSWSEGEGELAGRCLGGHIAGRKLRGAASLRQRRADAALLGGAAGAAACSCKSAKNT